MTQKIRATTTFKTIMAIIAALLAANCLFIALEYTLGHDHVFGIARLFDFNAEKSVPTFFASLLLFTNAVALLLIAVAHRENDTPCKAWLGLAFIFAFVAIDEASAIHEPTTAHMREATGAEGLMWLEPLFLIFVVLTVIYLKFYLRLPKETKIQFFFSAVIFLSGAYVMDVIGGGHAEKHGYQNFPYAVMTTIEELLEMVGSGLFLYSLLRYMQITFRRVSLDLV